MRSPSKKSYNNEQKGSSYVISTKEAAAAAATAEAETQNNLSQHEVDQSEQNLHDELNLDLRALEMKKAHLANQLATKKRAAEQAQKISRSQTQSCKNTSKNLENAGRSRASTRVTKHTRSSWNIQTPRRSRPSLDKSHPSRSPLPTKHSI